MRIEFRPARHAVLATAATLLLLQAGPAVSASGKTNPKTELTRVSADGYLAFRAIADARIAIFEGETAAANRLLADAQKALELAVKSAPTYSVTKKMTLNGKVVENVKESGKLDLIPIDGRIVLADNFVMTPEKKEQIRKANEHLRRGEHQQAMERLQQGEIDVSFSRLLMPLANTQRHVTEAQKLMVASNFYEANLALKAAEDGLQSDTVTLVEPTSATNKAAAPATPPARPPAPSVPSTKR